jgi:DNA-binding transcriptional regulator GbsR (MarR family)
MPGMLPCGRMRYVLQNQNVPHLPSGQRAFVEDMGQHMLGWGISRNTGRIYGYLLLQPGPASLDQIAGAIGMAKSGVSLATRQLVQLGLARGIGERGSRRLLYEALPNLEAIYAARNAQALDLMERLRQGARATESGTRRAELERLADTMQEFIDLFPTMMREMHDRRRA